MIIKLKQNFFIEVDEQNYTLKSEYLNKKTEEKATRTHGYFTSFESAIQKYIKLAVLEANDGYTIELNDLLEKIKTVCEETIQAIKERF